MTGLVETWARQIGWQVRSGNVIVEGESDVALISRARNLFLSEQRIDIFGGDLAVLAAGHRDDGGVDGVNRRLNAARQIAEADLGPDGTPKFRFIGLFDNDEAGRRAMKRACSFDRRVIRYQDIFLLHPLMPPRNKSPGQVVEQRAGALNRNSAGLDWEIEDLLSADLLKAFQADNPAAVVREVAIGGFIHRDFTRQGKADLRRYVLGHAKLPDVMGLVRLVCALRDYLQLKHDHISL